MCEERWGLLGRWKCFCQSAVEHTLSHLTDCTFGVGGGNACLSHEIVAGEAKHFRSEFYSTRETFVNLSFLDLFSVLQILSRQVCCLPLDPS